MLTYLFIHFCRLQLQNRAAQLISLRVATTSISTESPKEGNLEEVENFPDTQSASQLPDEIKTEQIRNDINMKILKTITDPTRKHPILFLSDEDFASTTVGEMMSWYGEADGGGTCAKDFGNELAERWRQTKKANCRNGDAPSSITTDKIENSRMDCYLVQQTRHHGGGDNICHMQSVSVNVGQFADEAITTPVVETYVDTRHAIQPYIPFKRGFIKANCDVVENEWIASHMPGWNLDWSFNGFQSGPLTDNELKCDEIIEHNVLVVQRDTFANFFHDSEDFFNVFLAMAVLNWPFSDTQVYITDLYPKGAFW